MKHGFAIIGAIIITLVCIAIAGAFNWPFSQGSPGQPTGPYNADQLSQQSAIAEQQRKAVEMNYRRQTAIRTAQSTYQNALAEAQYRLQQAQLGGQSNPQAAQMAAQQYQQTVIQAQQQYQRAIQDANTTR